MLYCFQVLNTAETPLKKGRVELEKTQKSATMMIRGRDQLPHRKSLKQILIFELGKETPEGAVPQLYKMVNGEQDLSEEWLFISFYNTEKMRDSQLNYQAKGFKGTKASIFSYAPN